MIPHRRKQIVLYFIRALPAVDDGLGLRGVRAKKVFPATKASPGTGLARGRVQPACEPEFWVDVIADARLALALEFNFFLPLGRALHAGAQFPPMASSHVAWSGRFNCFFSSNPTATNIFALKI